MCKCVFHHCFGRPSPHSCKLKEKKKNVFRDRLPFPHSAALLHLHAVLLVSWLKGLNYNRDKTVSKRLRARVMKSERKNLYVSEYAPIKGVCV